MAVVENRTDVEVWIVSVVRGCSPSEFRFELKMQCHLAGQNQHCKAVLGRHTEDIGNSSRQKMMLIFTPSVLVAGVLLQTLVLCTL